MSNNYIETHKIHSKVLNSTSDFFKFKKPKAFLIHPKISLKPATYMKVYAHKTANDYFYFPLLAFSAPLCKYFCV